MTPLYLGKFWQFCTDIENGLVQNFVGLMDLVQRSGMAKTHFWPFSVQKKNGFKDQKGTFCTEGRNGFYWYNGGSWIESFLCDSSWCDSVSRYDSGHYITKGFIRVKTWVTSILWLIMTHCTESQPYIVTQIMTLIMTGTYSIILWFINGLIRVTTRHITALTLWTLPLRGALGCTRVDNDPSSRQGLSIRSPSCRCALSTSPLQSH